MSGIILLTTMLEKFKSSQPDGLNDDDVFEIYCADNILINYDLDAAEIESGLVDGPKDAGIDAAYVFINKNLIREDFNFSTVKQPVEIELCIIQVKNQEGFKESPVDKLSASLPLLLDHSQTQASLEALFKPPVVRIFKSFFSAMTNLAAEFPKVSIRIYYCCKGSEPNGVIKAKEASLIATLKTKFTNVDFINFGAQELYERSGNQKRIVKDLATVGTPLSATNSYVALSKLSDYIDMISDEYENLITPMFEANVRAYQGEVEVNKEIQTSLSVPTSGVDFWWLNNGVTIVADQAQFMNNKLTIENPLIVNGLQTSHVLHYSRETLPQDDGRLLLVRVIVEKDREKRDEIIRATNRQTNIKHSSFRATEPIHREIEDYLLSIGYYYDRRKNLHKREGRPANKIISIDRLSQAALSVLRQEPHTARARPTTAIKEEKDYLEIFSGDRIKHPLEMYGVIVRLLICVEDYFRSIASTSNQLYRNNLKFHVLMVLSWNINGNKTLPAIRVAQLDPDNATELLMQKTTDWVFSEFTKYGAEDKTAKDSSFTQHLIANWVA
jgi:hypothetical protein